MDTLGLYVSVPFCRAKCSFCNFASGVFADGRMERYAGNVCREIETARARAQQLEAQLPETIDTIYLGGGTPSLLAPAQVRQLFETIRSHFKVTADAEITVEAAPGQLAEATLAEAMRQGMNRVSFGVQSFVDRESSAVGRLHTRAMCEREIERMLADGLNTSIDLIAGLPYQTEQSWNESLDAAIALQLPHISVYMLEVDGESRLGREMLAGGTRFHAHAVPSEDISADLYTIACARLEAAGIAQYEISNFARSGWASRHNMKYWHRQPYLGCGMDAHSMLRTGETAVRFCNVDDLDAYEARPYTEKPVRLAVQEALEESLFLGLRLNEGVSLEALQREFGADRVQPCVDALVELQKEELLEARDGMWRLTLRGRLLSNEVFSRLLLPVAA